jgi:hypothetical protein
MGGWKTEGMVSIVYKDEDGMPNWSPDDVLKYGCLLQTACTSPRCQVMRSSIMRTFTGLTIGGFYQFRFLQTLI